MELPGRARIVTMILMLIVVFFLPHRGWGQKTDRIGTVLVVEGTAEVRAQDATEWERLRFRDAIFLNDTVRTAEDSKVKVLLRDDTIMTLAERSEMQFTEFLLTKEQRSTIVNLFIGKIRVLTTRIFGAGSATEVHTPNAVAGVRGSEENVHYDDAAQKTTCLCVSAGEEDSCYLRDPTDPTKVLPVPVGHLAVQVGVALPTSTRPATSAERQEIAAGTTATAQVPGAVQKAAQQEQRQIAEPSARTDLPSPPPLTQELPPPPPPTTDIEQAGQLNQLEIQGQQEQQLEQTTETTTPDDNPEGNKFIEQATLSLTIKIPR